ncbi:MAG: penicillin-binding transpeptidase domain-containing protein [Oscillospiraceae bacterium]
MDKTLIRRISFLILFLLIVLGTFCMRLVDFQLVNGEKYLKQAVNTCIYEFDVTAARGEIVDRNGSAIATNRTGFNVTLSALMLPADKLNDTLIELVDIFKANGETWNDKTPITVTMPYEFTGIDIETGISKDAERMKQDPSVRLSTYATADQVLAALVKTFKLEDYTSEQQRIIGGLRYQMSQSGYSSKTNFEIAQDVSDATVATIKERSLRLPGVEIVEQAIRTYPDGTVLPHLIGLVGPIYREEWVENKDELERNGYEQNSIKGNSGLELAFEKDLRGKNGTMQIERTLDGTLKNSEITLAPQPGNTLMLTVDKKLQQDAEASLAKVINKMQTTKKHGEGKEANAGSIVVIDTKTGGVLASVNYPSYDLNKYRSDYQEYASNPDKPLLNRAFRGLYRAGSSFKPIVGLTGLLNGKITKDFTYNCTGKYTLYSAYGYTGDDIQAHGRTDIYRALEQSCNCFFYDVGRIVGVDAFNATANAMGLAVKTGVEVTEEVGHLNNEETAKALGVAWNPLGDTCQAAIGQKETAITTLQLATYASTLANKGTRYKTHLVSSTRDYNTGKLIEDFPPTIESELPDKNNAYEEIEKGMVLTAQNHSGGFLTNYPYTIAMKTGTPETGHKNEYGEKLFNASIVAYGPVENPELAIGIIVENANYGYQLSECVKDIFDSYYINKTQSMSPMQSGVLLR